MIETMLWRRVVRHVGLVRGFQFHRFYESHVVDDNLLQFHDYFANLLNTGLHHSFRLLENYRFSISTFL